MKKFVAFILVLALAGSVFANERAPELGVKDTTGQEWTLKRLEKDKVYLVEFWATWCTTCKKIAPIVTDFVDQNRGKSFEFLSVSVDTDKKALANYLREKKPKYPVLLDPTFKMAQSWDAVQVPKMFLVKNGQVMWSKVGEVSRKELDEALAKAKQGSTAK